ncbi:MAG: hypothetical protein AAF387_08990 [Pseudomonadota bacterium]
MYLINRDLVSRFLVTLIILWCAQAAHAIPIYRAGTDITTIPGPGASDESDAFAQVFTVADPHPIGGRTATAHGRAASFGLGSFALSIVPSQVGDIPFALSISSGATARLRFDDIVVTNEQDPGNSDPIDVSMSFLLDGVAGIFGSEGFPVEDGSDVRATAAVSVVYGFGAPGPGSTAIPDSIGSVIWEFDHGSLNIIQTGVLSDAIPGNQMSFAGTFETPTFSVPVDESLVLYLEIIASASAVSRDGSAVGAQSDFLNTLTLPSFGPVFDLPEGYTANSVAGNIVDNVYVAPVPIPATWLLLLSASAALVRRRTGRQTIVTQQKQTRRPVF